jgi:RHS repeat-associated protein
VNGSTVWSAKFESFGRAIIDPISLIQNNLRFPGQYYDQETGLHYNYHRYYDPMSGRYLRLDPVGVPGGTNLFVYTEDNPINHTDPLGLVAIPFPSPVPVPLPLPPVFIPGTTENKKFVEDTKWLIEQIKKAITGAGCEEQDKPCPPCRLVDGTIVPLGTIAYRWDVLPSDVKQHGISGEHLNLYRANQNPNNCRCFWQPIGAVKPPPEPGWIPIQPFAN